MIKTINKTFGFAFVTFLSNIPAVLASVTNAEERIVTYITVLQSPTGVPLDFSYNQTFTKIQGGLKSVPGCPRSIDGYPWVYYGNPPRCFLAGYQGPCPKQMSLFLQGWSSFGICSCDCFKDENRVVQNSPDGRYKLCGISYLPKNSAYDKETKTCYPFWQQGPCNAGEWFVQDRYLLSVTCVPECPQDTPRYYDSKTGDCIKVPDVGSGSGNSGLNPQDCIPPKVYSNVWKGCIDGPGDFLFLN